MLRIFQRFLYAHRMKLKPTRTYTSNIDIIRKAKRRRRTKKQKIHQNHEVTKYVMDATKNKTLSSGVLDTVRTENLLHMLQTNPSHMLGYSLEEVTERVGMFRDAGIVINDAISLAFVIPSCVHVNNNNFKDVIELLREYKLPVEKLLYHSPYIGAIEYVQLKRNLKILKQCNFKSEMADLILKYPILLSYQLNENSLAVLESLDFDKSRTVTHYVQESFDAPAVQNQIVNQLLLQGADGIQCSEDVKQFFINYNIDVEELYQKCPFLPMEALEKSIDCVLSAPFYFDVEDVKHFISNYPDILISFHQENVLSQVRYIEKVLTSKYHLYQLIMQHAEVFRDPEKFFDRVSLFKTFRFIDEDIGRMLSQKNAVCCFMDCDDYTDETLTELLQLYLQQPKQNLEPIHVIYSSPICLSSRSLPIIIPRLGYIRYLGKLKDIPKIRKFKKDNLTLRRIIRSDTNRFVELCGTTLEEFEKFAETFSY